MLRTQVYATMPSVTKNLSERLLFSTFKSMWEQLSMVVHACNLSTGDSSRIMSSRQPGYLARSTPVYVVEPVIIWNVCECVGKNIFPLT